MAIRFATFEDLDQIMALYKHLIPNDLEMDEKRLKTVWQEIMGKNDTYRYIVAEENGELLSTCNIAIVPNLTRSARPYAVIENVITHPNARQKGLGRGTIEFALDYAKQQGCYKVMLLSGSHRTEAHQFYERLGFNGSKKRGFVIEYL